MKNPDKISSYFKKEIWLLVLITISGILYNIGMTAGPYFEGQLVKRLLDIMSGQKTAMDMVRLSLVYLAVIFLVQSMRCIKRFGVRRFANNTARSMRGVLYNGLVYQTGSSKEQQLTGSYMTKAIADVDACADGMRKFTTEIFDTGVVMLAYLVMLLCYDWRLTLLSCIFTPFAYLLAETLKKRVVRYTAASKKSADQLNAETMSRITNALTYRVYGREQERNTHYETSLADYEKRSIYANLWEGTLQPLYHIISMTGVLFILYFGAKNVLGTGFTLWDIAAFTTFLSCFAKLAKKASKAAKLFNAVQKARVSWMRLKPLLHEKINPIRETTLDLKKPVCIQVQNVSFSYPDGPNILEHISFETQPGQIIGITGPVASGKSTLGGLFLDEYPYTGSILIAGQELHSLSDYERSLLLAYQGHDPQLFSDTIASNIQLGKDKDPLPFLRAVCLKDEVDTMPDGIHTFVGDRGIRLSGGQQARLALARALYADTPVLILDDPFSAVDQACEREIFHYLRTIAADKTILLISHRLSLFPDMDQVIWLENKKAVVSTHEKLMQDNPLYAHMVNVQTAGGDLDEA